MSLKNPVTPPGIDPGTFRLVALPQAPNSKMYFTKINLWVIEMDLGVKQKSNFKLTSEDNVDNSWKGIIDLLNWFLGLMRGKAGN
jgi:hypothetical protein